MLLFQVFLATMTTLSKELFSVREYRYIPEAYGLQGSAEASVTKHLSRKKLEQEQVTGF